MAYLSILRLLLKYSKHVEKSAHIILQLNEFSQTDHMQPSPRLKNSMLLVP